MPIKAPRWMLLLLLAAAALGSDLPNPTLQLLEQLGSAEYQLRQAATTRLLTDRTLTEDQIVSLYARAASPEQRHRLMAVAQHHLLRRLREQSFQAEGNGAIGTKPDALLATQLTHLGRPAIRVRDTMPGMPAYEELIPGDLILAVDGRDLNGPVADTIIKTFVNSIKAKPAGRTVRLTVLRSDRRLDVELRLANREALDKMYISKPNAISSQLTEPFARAWSKLRDRLLAAANAHGPPPHRTGIEPPRPQT